MFNICVISDPNFDALSLQTVFSLLFGGTMLFCWKLDKLDWVMASYVRIYDNLARSWLYLIFSLAIEARDSSVPLFAFCLPFLTLGSPKSSSATLCLEAISSAIHHCSVEQDWSRGGETL